MNTGCVWMCVKRCKLELKLEFMFLHAPATTSLYHQPPLTSLRLPASYLTTAAATKAPA